jgi:hypothetical protein
MTVRMLESRSRTAEDRLMVTKELKDEDMALNIRRIVSVSDIESAVEAVKRFIERERLLNNPINRENNEEKIEFYRIK